MWCFLYIWMSSSNINERVCGGERRGGAILPCTPTGIGFKQINVYANLKLGQTLSGNA